MKRYLAGLLTGIILMSGLLLFTAATPAADDSLAFYINKLESLLNNELAKNRENGRFQLQSHSIDRTHWHYLLDTATGELYKLELNRTPENSRWVLLTEGNFDR